VLKAIEAKSYSVKLQAMKAVTHITGKKDLLQSIAKVDEEYKASIISKPIKEINWKETLDKLHKNRNQSLKAFQSFLIGIIMYYHPRRFGDYYHLSTTIGKDNYYSQGVIHFTKFKNVKSNTAGETEITVHKKAKIWIEKYIAKYEIQGRFFSMTGRQFRYLMEKANLPLTTDNRKFQETCAIQSGQSRVEIARKFNHSLATQCLSYQKTIKPLQNP
jgi:hypothetical protein